MNRELSDILSIIDWTISNLTGFGEDSIDHNLTLLELGLDSLDMVEFEMKLEDQFGFSEKDYDEMFYKNQPVINIAKDIENYLNN